MRDGAPAGTAGDRFPRLFVAVDLPAEARRFLAALAPVGEGLRPVREEDLHLTLHFLGAGDPGWFREALAAVRAPRFSLEFTGIAFVRRPRGGGIVWMGVAPGAALTALWRRSGLALAGTGRFVGEPRTFRPHITLARGPRRCPFPEAEGPRPRRAERPAPVPVESFSLVSTRENGDGPRYRREGTFPLGDG